MKLKVASTSRSSCALSGLSFPCEHTPLQWEAMCPSQCIGVLNPRPKTVAPSLFNWWLKELSTPLSPGRVSQPLIIYFHSCVYVQVFLRFSSSIPKVACRKRIIWGLFFPPIALWWVFPKITSGSTLYSEGQTGAASRQPYAILFVLAV